MHASRFGGAQQVEEVFGADVVDVKQDLFLAGVDCRLHQPVGAIGRDRCTYPTHVGAGDDGERWLAADVYRASRQCLVEFVHGSVVYVIHTYRVH